MGRLLHRVGRFCGAQDAVALGVALQHVELGTCECVGVGQCGAIRAHLPRCGAKRATRHRTGGLAKVERGVIACGLVLLMYYCSIRGLQYLQCAVHYQKWRSLTSRTLHNTNGRNSFPSSFFFPYRVEFGLGTWPHDVAQVACKYCANAFIIATLYMSIR